MHILAPVLSISLMLSILPILFWLESKRRPPRQKPTRIEPEERPTYSQELDTYRNLCEIQRKFPDLPGLAKLIARSRRELESYDCFNKEDLK